MIALVTTLVVASMQGQGALAVREMLLAEEMLDDQAIRTVLETTRQAMAGKTFRMHGGFSGGEVELDAEGHPHFFRQDDQVTEWTGDPAVSCKGASLDGELVVEWHRRLDAWEASSPW